MLQRISALRAFSSSYMMAMPMLTAAIAIAAYALAQDGEISPAVLFSALSAFGQLRLPLMFFPQALASRAQFYVSYNRLSRFLAMRETEREARVVVVGEGDRGDSGGGEIDSIRNEGGDSPLPYAVQMRGSTFSWAPSSSTDSSSSTLKIALSNVHLSVTRGAFVSR